MRILMIHNYYQKPGGESAVFDDERAILAAEKHEVILYTRDNNELLNMGRAARYLTYAQMFFSLTNYLNVRRLVKRTHPEVALVQNVYPLISPSIYYALQRLGIPIVQLVHQHRFVCINAQLYVNGAICELCSKGNFIHSLPRRCFRNDLLMSAGFAFTLWFHTRVGTFAKLIDAFIVPDLFMKSKLEGIGIPCKRIYANTNPYYPPQEEPNCKTGNYILFVGRLEPQKGLSTLVNAMKEVHSDVKLVIMGEGYLRGQIEEQIRNDKIERRIEIRSPVWGEEFAKVIKGAKFIVVPSEWYDNGVLVPYYAFGHGRPVIASRIHGLIEEVDHEVNGLLFETGKSFSLAQAINRLYEDHNLWMELSKNARHKAITQLNSRKHYERLMEIIDQAIEQKHISTGKTYATWADFPAN